MESFEKYQKQLLDQTQYIYYETPISAAMQRAYLEMPRHRFVKRYHVWVTKEWCEVNKDNLRKQRGRPRK